MIPHPLPHFVSSKLSHCSSALLCLLRFRISLPLLQPPDNHVSSSHLQDFILDFCWFSFSSWAPNGWLLLLTQLSAQMPLLSQPALSACVICPHLHVRLFAYLVTCSLSPHLSVNSTNIGTLSGLCLEQQLWTICWMEEITSWEFLLSSPLHRLFQETKLEC